MVHFYRYNLITEAEYLSRMREWPIFNEGSAFSDIFVLLSLNDMTQWPAQTVAQHEL